MEGAIQGRLEGKGQKATNTSILRLWRLQSKSTAKQLTGVTVTQGREERPSCRLAPPTNHHLIQIHYCVDAAQEQLAATS